MIKRINSLDPVFKKIFAILIVITITTFSISFVRASSSTGAESNSIFPKLYAISNDQIYYTNLYDNKIYKMNLNNNERFKICNDSVSDNGIIFWNQWIYYINSTNNTLYKIKEDGTSKISLGEIKFQVGSDSFFVWENHMYYIDSKLILHKIDSYGEEINILDDKEYDILFRINSKAVQNGSMIYVPNKSGIIKINIETGEKIKLCEDGVYDNIIVKDNWIYYVNYEDYKLYRVSTDGNEKTKINDDIVVAEGADYDTGSFYIIGESIYYTATRGGTAKLVKVSLNGQNKSTIIDKVMDFTIDGKYIYYFDSVDDGGLYKVKLDGSDKNKVVSGSFLPYVDLEQNLIIYGVKSIDINQPYDGRLFILNQNNNQNMELK
jgi:hypothetical protein